MWRGATTGLICIIIFDWILLLHVSMHQEQGLFTTKLSWGLLGLVRLIKIYKKLNTGALYIQAKLSKIWKQRQIVQKSFQKFRKLLNFRNVNHSIGNSKKIREQRWMERTLPRKKKSRKLGYTSRGCPLFWKFGNCCSIRYRKLLKTQTGRFGWMEIKHPRSLDSELFVGQKKKKKAVIFGCERKTYNFFARTTWPETQWPCGMAWGPGTRQSRPKLSKIVCCVRRRTWDASKLSTESDQETV